MINILHVYIGVELYRYYSVILYSILVTQTPLHNCYHYFYELFYYTRSNLDSHLPYSFLWIYTCRKINSYRLNLFAMLYARAYVILLSYKKQRRSAHSITWM